MEAPPPSYNCVMTSRMEVDSAAPRTERLPMHFEIGRVEETYPPPPRGQEAKTSGLLLLSENHKISNYAKLCNALEEAIGGSCGPEVTANGFLHPAFKKYVLDLLHQHRPDLKELCDLRLDSMKHILERSLEKWSQPEEVISELLGRVFGLMCALWDLLHKEDLLIAQVNFQAIGLKKIEEEFGTVQQEVNSNLIKAETIVKTLEQQVNDKTPETVKEVKALVDGIAGHVKVLADGRQNDMVLVIANTRLNEELNNSLLTAGKALETENARVTKLEKTITALGDTVVKLEEQNAMVGQLLVSKDQTIATLQQLVALLQSGGVQ